MRVVFLGSLVALFTLHVAAACHAGYPGAGVTRQQISVTLVPAEHLVRGESIVTYSGVGGKVELRLAPEAAIGSVSVSGKKSAFSFAGGVLSLQLSAVAEGETIPVAVSYSATFNDPVSRHPAASEDPSYGVNGAITEEGTFLGGGAFWYPVPSRVPLRRSITISAPAGTEAVTFGRRVSRGTAGAVTTSTWEEARPVGLLSLAAGPYKVEERSVEGVPLYSYLYPQNANLSQRYLDAAARYVGFYSSLFGPFPFEKFAVVENFFPTGYGFPSFTLLGGSVIRLPFIVDTSFPHEIAHSWFGNGIEPREGNWSEGLVTYLADYLLKERRASGEARDYRRQILIDYTSLVTPSADFPLTAFESRSDPASRAIGYGKGAMIFHMIRSEIGDAAFFDALRQICRDHLYRSASWSDLLRAFSRSAGRDLSHFTQQWLTRTGGPRLTLSEVTSRREGAGWIVSGSILQSPPFFEVGVPLVLESEGKQVREVVQLKDERTRFSIAASAAPNRLLLDPDAEIFRILPPDEIPATVNSIKGSTRLTGVVTEDCRAGREGFRKLLASLSQGEAPLMNESELGALGGGGRDLLFCGMPRNRSLFSGLPPGIEVTGSGFTVEGARYAGPDALLMLVLKSEGGGGPVRGLFLPLSEAAAADYAAKITHYGKYASLAFAGGSNRHKGMAGASGGGAVVELRKR